MDTDPLFLAKLADLEKLIASTDEYDILTAAAIVRQLLLDGSNSLVTQVNRGRKLRVRFVVVNYLPMMELMLADKPDVYSVEGAFAPAPNMTRGTRVVKLDELLALPMMYVHGHRISVHELVDQLCHVEGGVHAGASEGEKQKALAQAHRVFGVGGLPLGLLGMSAIGRVVLTALQELRDVVASEQSSIRANQPDPDPD